MSAIVDFNVDNLSIIVHSEAQEDTLGRLTQNQQEILTLVNVGVSQRQIGELLQMPYKQVGYEIQEIGKTLKGFPAKCREYAYLIQEGLLRD